MEVEKAYQLRKLIESNVNDRPDDPSDYSLIPVRLKSWDPDSFEASIRVRIEIVGVGEFSLDY